MKKVRLVLLLLMVAIAFTGCNIIRDVFGDLLGDDDDVGGGGTSVQQDAYEDDVSNDIVIFVNGGAQFHTFHSSSDEDWVYFDATDGVTYTIETYSTGTNEVDTLVSLLDDGFVELDYDDDGGTSLYSLLTFVADTTDTGGAYYSASGRYWIQITEYDSDVGEYYIIVTSS